MSSLLTGGAPRPALHGILRWRSIRVPKEGP